MTFEIDHSVLFAFSALWAAVVPTPGANVLMVTHVALTRGPRRVAFAIIGNLTGILLLAAGALLGMSALLRALPWIRIAIELLGAAYFLIFGSRLLRRALRPPEAAHAASASATGEAALWQTFVLGLATALSNAQAIIFITSIFAVTGVLSASAATGIACVIVMIAMNASYLGLLGWLFLRETPRRVYLRFGRWIEGSIGVLFVGLGLHALGRDALRLAR